MDNLLILFPEMTLLSMACLVLVVDLFLPTSKKVFTYLLTQISLIATAVLCWLGVDQNPSVFQGQFVSDPFSQFLKVVMLGLLVFVLAYSRPYVRDRQIARGEFHLLTLFSALGMMILVSSQSLLLLYLGLELLSLPLYALVVLQRQSGVAAEAGLKYFVMGALASGLLLYGMSLVFGITHTLNLVEIASQLGAFAGTDQFILNVGLVFMLAGVAFKLGAVPFHMWIPDVYQGAPTSVTLIIATAPKVAAFGMAFRIFAEGFVAYQPMWHDLMLGLAVASLAIGNIVAIAQTNLKRMLGYSTIAHIGFVLFGFLSGSLAGYSASLFYIVSYAIVAAGAFGVITILSDKGVEAENIADLRGLAVRSPWIAFLMLLILFSLAGVPPMIGFYAKLVILSALVKSGLLWLAVLAVVFSIIGAFYYLRVVKVMYFDAPTELRPVRGGAEFRVMLSINGLAVIGLGILPAPLFVICQTILGALA
ncbi:MAG: NADH-quinone oxidoreductase subunit NuoN [Gammaproteobacteria bacterium]